VANEAFIYAAKTLGDNGGSRSWSQMAIDWVVRHGNRPAVISMSLGGKGQSASYQYVIDTAVNRGVVIVVAAGNQNSNACGYSPAFVESAVTVGSTTDSDDRSPFSNFGDCVDIFAPGSGITSASHESDSGTRTLDGTSMACPHVSGAAAILLGGGSQPEDVVKQLKTRSSKGVVHDSKPGTPNELLYVGTADSPDTTSQAPPTGGKPSCSEKGWSVASGPCVIDDNCCLQNENFPSPYSSDQTCTIQVGSSPGTISVESFQTELGYDLLTVNGEGFDGESGPENIIPKGTITWKSDELVVAKGFKLCLPNLGLQAPGDKTEIVGGKKYIVPDACVKPWTYRRFKVRKYCTMRDHSQPWCSWDKKFRGNWAECTEADETAADDTAADDTDDDNA